MTPAELVTAWRDRAHELEPYAEGAARAFEAAAEELERALSASDNPLLTLEQARERSGYHRESLARMVRQGRLRNFGTPRRPLVRALDLPMKPSRPPLTPRRAAGIVGAQ